MKIQIQGQIDFQTQIWTHPLVKEQPIKINNNNNFKASLEKNRQYSYDLNAFKIQEIYEIDSITLQELLDEFQLKISPKLHRKIQGESSLNQLYFEEVSGASRNLKKWYQLAKIEIQQRKKVEQFAFRLINQNFQPFQANQLPNFLKKQSKNLILSQNNECIKQHVCLNSQVNALILQKDQISIKLPPINIRKSQNSKSLKKLDNFQQKREIKVLRKEQNILKKAQLDTIKSSQQKFNTLKRIQTIESLRSTNVTVGQVKKDSKVMSKKDFLQMMKIQLNKGAASDYRTGTFIKQPFKIKSIAKQYSSSIKNNSLYQNNQSCYKNQSLTEKNSRKQQTLYRKTQSVTSRTKTKSVFIKNNIQQIEDSHTSRVISKNSTISNSKASLINQPKQITLSNGPINLPIISKEILNKIQINEKQNKTDSSHQNLLSLLKNTQSTKQISETSETKNSTAELKNTLMKLIKGQTQVIIIASKLSNQQMTKPFQNKIQTFDIKFIQNDDAYDDEPQKLKKIICLKQQQKLILNKQNQLPKNIESNQNLFSNGDNQIKINQHSITIQQNAACLNKGNYIDKILDESITYVQTQIHIIDTHTNIDLQSETTQNIQLKMRNKSQSQKNLYNQKYQFINCINSVQSILDNNQIQNQTMSLQKDIQTVNPQIEFVKQTNLIPKQTQIKKTNTILSNANSLSKDLQVMTRFKYPPYHQQFSSFSDLFNITSLTNGKTLSLLHILKAMQTSLQIYFKKNIEQYACDQMNNKAVYLKKFNDQQTFEIDSNSPDQNLQVKVITQLQFLRNTQTQPKFFIDLDTFKQKSINLLNKLRNPNFYIPKAKQRNNLKQKQNKSKQQYISCELKTIQKSSQIRKLDQFLYYRVVKTKQQVYDIINTTFYRNQNWLQLPHGMELHGCWNLLWTWSKPQIDFNSLIKFQKVNHFINSKQLARKDLLKKNIQKIKKLSKKLNQFFDIIPETFFLPGENVAFIKKFRQSERQNQNLWILKPVGLSRGRGISLINQLEDVVFSEPIVMQKYIHNPFLLDDYKFDLRIYVLVTSINPLECFIYKEGFARVSTEKYTKSVEQIGNKYIHLTNFSIQKDSQKFPQIFTAQQKQIGGCKLTLKMLEQKLIQRGVEWDKIWLQVEQVVLKSLISCMKYIPQNPNCFQLFGYDIMMDSDLKCWLIEVNSSPSLQKDFLIDQILKQQLIDDTIQIVDPIQFDRVQLLKVIQRRRKQCQGLKSHVNFSNNSTEQLNEDLFKILKGKKLRNYGEIKENKNYKCIAPSSAYQKILKTVQHYTHDVFVKNSNFY